MDCKYDHKYIIITGEVNELFNENTEINVFEMLPEIKKVIQEKTEKLHKKLKKEFPISMYLYGFNYRIISEAQISDDVLKQIYDVVKNAHIAALGQRPPYNQPIDVKIVKH